jgi:hypothetical protein
MSAARVSDNRSWQGYDRCVGNQSSAHGGPDRREERPSRRRATPGARATVGPGEQTNLYRDAEHVRDRAAVTRQLVSEAVYRLGLHVAWRTVRPSYVIGSEDMRDRRIFSRCTLRRRSYLGMVSRAR